MPTDEPTHSPSPKPTTSPLASLPIVAVRFEQVRILQSFTIQLSWTGTDGRMVPLYRWKRLLCVILNCEISNLWMRCMPLICSIIKYAAICSITRWCGNSNVCGFVILSHLVMSLIMLHHMRNLFKAMSYDLLCCLVVLPWLTHYLPSFLDQYFLEIWIFLGNFHWSCSWGSPDSGFRQIQKIRIRIRGISR